MGTWMEAATKIIDDVNRSLPADADLDTRKRAIRTARPSGFSTTSWGRKVWPKAVKQYLKPYGAKSDAGIPPRHLSPLERLMGAGAGK